MKINLKPIRYDKELTLVKNGKTLTLNGDEFDLSVIPEGATLPNGAIDSIWFAGDVVCGDDGELELTLLLPHGANAPEETLFPEPIINPADGPILLPQYEIAQLEFPTAGPMPLQKAEAEEVAE